LFFDLVFVSPSPQLATLLHADHGADAWVRAGVRMRLIG
jgi:low temperature requirement protein LtrA